MPLEDIEDCEALIPDRGWLSEHLGFLTDKHIINVGITRCQYGLVIVGKWNDIHIHIIDSLKVQQKFKYGRKTLKLKLFVIKFWDLEVKHGITCHNMACWWECVSNPLDLASPI